jgi:hypothetical protein
VNSVCLHIALTEGHNIAWWFRATRTDATIQDLHEIWAYGTSTVSALSSGRKFNYIALATLFVATIPLNGLILQNSIAIVPVFQTTNLYSTFPTQTSLPLGWSAPINSDGTIGLLGGQTSLRMWNGVQQHFHVQQVQRAQDMRHRLDSGPLALILPCLSTYPLIMRQTSPSMLRFFRPP